MATTLVIPRLPTGLGPQPTQHPLATPGKILSTSPHGSGTALDLSVFDFITGVTRAAVRENMSGVEAELGFYDGCMGIDGTGEREKKGIRK